MKHLKLFENWNIHNIGDYFGYKIYLGLPPIIVQLLSIRENQAQIGKKNKYFVELVEEPHTTYVLNNFIHFYEI